jgi:hypothetical protein
MAMHTKKLLLEKFKDLQNETIDLGGIKYIPNISRDFLNVAKRKDIKSFIKEMNPLIIRSTIASANEPQLRKIILAVHGNKRLVSKLQYSLI